MSILINILHYCETPQERAKFRLFRSLTVPTMNDPEEYSTSLYDYSDKSVAQAGYAAITYGVISLFTGLLAWIQYTLYHRPGRGGVMNEDFAAQQYLLHTPFLTAVSVAVSVTLAVMAGILAFFIFRRSRCAIVTMLVLVILLQLYAWFFARSIGGTLLSIVVVAFLLRGAKRMFQDHAERAPEAGNAS